MKEVTAAQILRAVSAMRATLFRRAAREGWPYREVAHPGRPLRLYPVAALPADIRSALEAERADHDQPPLNALSTAVDAQEKGSENLTSAPTRREFFAAAASAGTASAAAIGSGADTDTSIPAPARSRGRRAGECHPDAWLCFKAHWLRPEQPTAEASVRAVLRIAEARGWQPVPRYAKYYLRRIERELSPQAVTLARSGVEALDRMRPPQIRDREALFSMELVCADGHRWDVRVIWPDGAEARPLLVAWQDIRSGKILAWRLGPAETSDLYRLSCADMLWECGAPEAVIVDNGRGIAARCLTGGLPNRYRGTVSEDEPVGLLTELVGKHNVHWTTPYSGQSKPIERSFRDFASDIAKDIRLAGAYTGKDTVSKPANYGARAIPLETFRAVVADGVAQHNSRSGRRGQGMRGRSCDQVFEQSLPAAGLRKLAPERLARWLLASAQVTAHAEHGSVQIHGARYWSEALGDAFAGRSKGARQAVVRFDPERLDRAVIVERPDGRPVGIAEPQGRVPYLSAEAAKEHAKAKANARKAAKAELKAALELDAAAAAALLDEVESGVADPGSESESGSGLELELDLPNVLEVQFAEAEGDEAGLEELARLGEKYTLAQAGLGD